MTVTLAQGGQFAFSLSPKHSSSKYTQLPSWRGCAFLQNLPGGSGVRVGRSGFLSHKDYNNYFNSLDMTLLAEFSCGSLWNHCGSLIQRMLAEHLCVPGPVCVRVAPQKVYSLVKNADGWTHFFSTLNFIVLLVTLQRLIGNIDD